jgi:hypothetical protein
VVWFDIKEVTGGGARGGGTDPAMTDPTMPTKSPKREEQAEVGMRFTVRVLKDRMRRPEGRGVNGSQ